MKRREFITLLGGAAAAARRLRRGRSRLGPSSRSACGASACCIQYAETDKEALAHMAAFREELQKTGWTDGHNIRIDYRGALNEESRQRFAKELVALQPDLLLSGGTAPTVALLRQTRSIPIIFVNSADPVGSGLATSLARPGGNVTGFINLEPTMASKWLELLKAGCAARGQYRILVQPRNRALC